VLLAFEAEAREGRTPAWDKIAEGREAGKPVFAVIGLRQQKITVYDSEGPILQAPVSTGRRAYETPAGVFTILQKNRDHVSNLYEDAEMPFMQRITWSGIALHAGPLPGYRASHGCVRLPYRFAERLFDLTGVGTRVVIAPNKVAAANITHPVLEQLQKDGASATAAVDLEQARELATSALKEAAASAKAAEPAATKARRAEAARDQVLKRLDAAVKRAEVQKAGPSKDRAEAQVVKLQADAATKTADADAATRLAQSAKAQQAVLQDRAREARLRAWPLSILVSRKTQRIYVRQGFEPVLEVPAVIADTQRPIGTHAFYATETAGGSRGWLSVSLDGQTDAAAREALERIELPPEVAGMLASSAWLGSALIVSDEAPYKETAAGTDFIVVLSGEPQGALKIRSPETARSVAQTSRPSQQQAVRAYRSVAQDHHFRHPLGSFP
jgi:hypothetical protein